MFKKVTVSGFVEDVFIGDDRAIEKYLIALKKRQMSLISEYDLKFYNKDAPTVKYAADYNNKIQSYYSPSSIRLDFRKKYEQYGLSIKIEPHVPENSFF